MPSSSLLNDEIGDVTDDDGLITDDAASGDGASTEAGAERGKVVAAIAVSVTIVVLLLVLAAVVMVHRAKRAHSNSSSSSSAASVVVVEQASPSAPAATLDLSGSSTGGYICSHCGSRYDFAEDLSKHAQLRH